MKNKKNKKAEVWVSVIIYTLVAILALALLLSTGLPILNEMRERTVFSKTKDIMLELDRHLTDLSNQGEGSQSTVSFEIREGKIFFDEDQITWEIEAKSPIISPRTTSTLGNLIISANANIKTYESNTGYLLETKVKDIPFRVNITKIGDKNNWEPINTSKLINYIEYDTNKMDGAFNFNINEVEESTIGNGYTIIIPQGNHSNLGRAKVVAHINSSFAEYDLEFTLESYADFLTVKLKNFEPK
jgi:hypothetical protein